LAAGAQQHQSMPCTAAAEILPALDQGRLIFERRGPRRPTALLEAAVLRCAGTAACCKLNLSPGLLGGGFEQGPPLHLITTADTYLVIPPHSQPRALRRTTVLSNITITCPYRSVCGTDAACSSNTIRDSISRVAPSLRGPRYAPALRHAPSARFLYPLLVFLLAFLFCAVGAPAAP